MDLNKYQKAVETFRTGVEVAGDEPYGWILKAQLQWALGDINGAWEFSNRAVEVNPDDPRSHHFRGFIQSLHGSGATDRQSQTREVDDYLYVLEHLKDYPRVSIIHNNLGYVYYEMKKYKRAQKHFDLSIAQCPHHIQTYYNKAVCYSDQGLIEEAAELCNKMLEINPAHPEAYTLRGWIYIGRGQISRSIPYYRKAIEHQQAKDSYTMLIYLGGLCVLNRFQEAQELIATYLPIYEAKTASLRRKIDAAISREEERARLSGTTPQTSIAAKCRCKPSRRNGAAPAADPDPSAAIGDNGEILSCPTDLHNHMGEPNVPNIYDGPDSEMELIKYWKTKLIAVNSCLASCYRVLGEIALATGSFDNVPSLYQSFKTTISEHCKTSQKRTDTPFLKYCSQIDLSTIRPEVVEAMKHYHKLRESEDSEGSFRDLRTHIQHLSLQLNTNEQIYFLGCISHFVRPFKPLLSLFHPLTSGSNIPLFVFDVRPKQLLALFWEDDQFTELVNTLQEYWVHPEHPMSKDIESPRFLINLLDLITRLGDDNELTPILIAATAHTGHENHVAQMMRALDGMFAHAHHQHPGQADGEADFDVMGRQNFDGLEFDWEGDEELLEGEDEEEEEDEFEEAEGDHLTSDDEIDVALP